MSLEELISIERIETALSRLQETYVIDDLLLSRLFNELCTELKKGILPILDMHILLYVLTVVPFTDEAKGIKISEELRKCVNNELFGKTVTCKYIAKQIQKLQNLIHYEYQIEGSLVVYQDYHFDWYLDVHLL
jgi:hypothetical protein